MRKMRVAASTAALVAVVLLGAGVLPSTAQVPPAPIAAEPLTPRSAFTDDVSMKIKVKDDGGQTHVVSVDDPSRTVVVRYTIQPGAQFPWHSHAGPVVVNVVQGTLVYVGAEECDEHEYSAGTAFVDLGHGHVHSAYNPSESGETILMATFFESPETGLLLIPADAPAGCTLP